MRGATRCRSMNDNEKRAADRRHGASEVSGVKGPGSVRPGSVRPGSVRPRFSPSWRRGAGLLLLSGLALVACAEDAGDDGAVVASLAPAAEAAPSAPLVLGERSSAVTARGGRVLAMDVGPGPGETRAAAVAKAKAAGVTTVVLNYDWVELEPAAFQYQSAKLIADNAFYGAAPNGMSVVLNIRPIAGPCRVVPPDLANLAWSDPVMTTRFGYLLSWIRGHLPNVTVQVMSVGTEVDSYLAPADYPAYKVFFEAARQNAKAQWGAQLPVGVAITWGSLTTAGAEQSAILDLNERADHVLTTYYGIASDLTVKDPFNGPIADLYAALLAVESSAKTRGRPIDILEAGYPTSAALGSSDAKQAVFVQTMFGIWDAYYPRIPTIVFNWEMDLSEYSAQVVAIGGWGSAACQGPTGAPPAAPAAPVVTPRGPTGNRTWQYYIVACNGGGNSQTGAIAATTTGAATLSATSYNRLSWAAVPGATSYRVMRYAAGGAPATTGQIAVTTATTLDDTGLASSTFIFQEFLRTLGLRTHTTPIVDKPALGQLGSEAHARGW